MRSHQFKSSYPERLWTGYRACHSQYPPIAQFSLRCIEDGGIFHPKSIARYLAEASCFLSQISKAPLVHHCYHT